MKYLHLIAYIVVSSFSGYEVMQGQELLWFSTTLVINVILIVIELFFSFGKGKITRDEIDAKEKQNKVDFKKFMPDK